MVRTESVETKEYESCQQNDVEVDRDESLKKLSFVPGAVSDSAGWREPLTGSPYKNVPTVASAECSRPTRQDQRYFP